MRKNKNKKIIISAPELKLSSATDYIPSIALILLGHASLVGPILISNKIKAALGMLRRSGDKKIGKKIKHYSAGKKGR